VETRRRTLVKSCSYRLVGGLVTTSVAYAATGKGSAAAAIGILDTIVKLGVFYAHERFWLRIDYGRSKEPEYHI
jgi:uncharacterized membrane protein